jgi:hypothetical protein
MTNNNVTAYDSLMDDLKHHRALGLTWREIADHYGLKPGTINAVYNRGYVPRNNDIRCKLGLSLLCPRCGEEIT